MLFCWYFALIGSFFLGFVDCQGNDQSAIINEPDVQVILSVDTGSKSSMDIPDAPESFACHECTNCNRKSGVTIRSCESDINMCYTIHKRINNINRILRRGCSISKGQCMAPNDEQINAFDSITCCTSDKCNQGIQYKPWFFLLIFNLLIMIINV